MLSANRSGGGANHPNLVAARPERLSELLGMVLYSARFAEIVSHDHADAKWSSPDDDRTVSTAQVGIRRRYSVQLFETRRTVGACKVLPQASARRE